MRPARYLRGVPVREQDEPVDYLRLAQFLDALAYPVRLELLHKLQFPQTVGEIEVTPHRRDERGSPERSLARQTVQGHLDKLMAAGLVVSEPVEQSGREVPVYRVEPSRLYALIEELRRLSVLYAGKGPGAEDTGTVSTRVQPQLVTGPRLVLIHGVYEGKAYPLDRSTMTDKRWTIGRDPEVPVALDYDPFVSSRNSVITRDRDGTFHITDLPDSKNGTTVNWVQLPEGGGQELRTGDVIGVGRSLLSFVAE